MKRLALLTLFTSLIVMSASLCYAQYTPGGFFSLARRGDIENLKKIIAQKPSQFVMDNALEAAMIGQQTEAIHLLVEHGANVNYINPNGTALLVNAIMLGFYDSATALIVSGADPNIFGFRRLYHGYPMDWRWTPLMAASYQGHLELVKKLVEKGAKINKEGYSISKDDPETAADIAAYSGHLEILKYLKMP